MPVVNLPDGRKINFPDGTSPEDMTAALSSLDGGQAAPAPQQGPPAPDQSAWYERAGQGIWDVGQGIGQLISRANPSIPQDVRQTIDREVIDRETSYQQRRGENAGSLDPMRMVGNVAATLPLAAVVPPGTTLARSVLSGAVTGGLTGGAQPVVNNQENFWSEKGTQAATGAGLGGVAGGAANLIGRAISPSVSPEVRSLIDEGVTPTPGQMGGRTARTVENMATTVPFAGNAPINAQRRAVEQFNIATVNRALRPLGEKLPDDVVAGNNAVEAARKIISQKYDDVLSKISGTPDAAFNQEIGAVINGLPAQEGGEFAKRIIAVLGKDVTTGKATLTGDVLKSARSQLHDLAERYARDPSVDKQLLGEALEQAADSLTGLAKRLNPEAAGELDTLGAAFARFARVRDAAAKNLESGVFSPAQYAQATRTGSGKSAYAAGNALDQPWAQGALKVLGPNMPAEQHPLVNLLGMGGAGAAAYAAPVPTALAAGGVSAAYSPMGQRLIASLMTGRQGDKAKALAEALRNAGPYAGGALGAAAAPAFNSR